MTCTGNCNQGRTCDCDTPPYTSEEAMSWPEYLIVGFIVLCVAAFIYFAWPLFLAAVI